MYSTGSHLPYLKRVLWRREGPSLRGNRGASGIRCAWAAERSSHRRPAQLTRLAWPVTSARCLRFAVVHEPEVLYHRVQASAG